MERCCCRFRGSSSSRRDERTGSPRKICIGLMLDIACIRRLALVFQRAGGKQSNGGRHAEISVRSALQRRWRQGRRERRRYWASRRGRQDGGERGRKIGELLFRLRGR